MIGVFVSGTDTGVGKTVVVAGLAAIFTGRGHSVGVLKPVETGGRRGRSGIPESSDIRFAASVCASGASLETSNPYCFETPCSPHLAAEIAGKEILPERIESAYEELARRTDIVIVEGVGGLMVPLTNDFFVCDLIRKLDIPLLIVSRNILGTINHSIMTIHHALSYGLKVLGVIFNHPTDAPPGFVEKSNPRVVRELTGVEVFGTIPFDRDLSVENNLPGRTVGFIREHVDINSLMQKLLN